MKSLKHSPQWNPMPDKSERHQIARNAKSALLPTPYSGMGGNFQVHVQGYVAGVGRIDARQGKGAETLFINLGVVNAVTDVENRARVVHTTITNG